MYRINDTAITTKYFAYDGCHKIYLLNNFERDKTEAISYGYEIRSIDELKSTYDSSCELRFIRSWDLNDLYVPQFEDAKFEGWD